MANKFSEYKKYTRPDAPDLRDRMYEPRLSPLQKPLDPPTNLKILDQGKEGACTGFGLAAVINHLFKQRNEKTEVSSRMLYEMAKRYDEWQGEDYAGSSCRGAIQGWKNMGVCSEKSWSSTKKSKKAYVTVERAKEARSNTLGAYYRIRPDIVDFHSALNETGIIYASAMVHSGWNEPKSGKIPYTKTPAGGHAFAIVGYNDNGFWIQNSWGEDWGNKGLALWSYQDWAANIADAWVVQLALPTPQIFDYTVSGNLEQASSHGKDGIFKSTPRSEIAGHFVHLDDGHYHDSGRYWSNLNDVTETSELLSTSIKYDHLMLYAHGGLNSPKASAGRIAKMKNVYLDNRIYPYHFMYDTGLLEEINDVLLGKQPELKSKMGGFSDWWDRRVENTSRKAGRALWRELKSGARKPFAQSQNDGTNAIKQLIGAILQNEQNIKLHVVGHSTGAILMAYLLQRLFLENEIKNIKVETCSLMAPAATIELYDSHYVPLLKNQSIKNMRIYNLTEKLEEEDTVASIYRKSLLKLVSRSFEESDVIPGNVPLLGMQDFTQHIDTADIPLDFVYSHGDTDDDVATKSETHGGFDNDPATMNDVLKRILNAEPARKFNHRDLDY